MTVLGNLKSGWTPEITVRVKLVGYPTRVLLKIFDTEFLCKSSYFEPFCLLLGMLSIMFEINVK